MGYVMCAALKFRHLNLTKQKSIRNVARTKPSKTQRQMPYRCEYLKDTCIDICKYLLLTSTHTHREREAKQCAGKCKCLESFEIKSMRLIKKQHKSMPDSQGGGE